MRYEIRLLENLGLPATMTGSLALITVLGTDIEDHRVFSLFLVNEQSECSNFIVRPSGFT